MKELIRLDTLVAICDMDVHVRSPPRGKHPVGRKIYFDPLVIENASKNTAFFLLMSHFVGCHHSKSTMTSSDVL